MGRKGKSGYPQGGGGPPTAIDAHEWWRKLVDEDPITLEPLKELGFPPFKLTSGINATGASHYFDAVALASYLTRRGIFENPLTREPLGLQECVQLDEHLRLHVPLCREFRVADALTLQRSIRVKSATSSQSVALRREATAALHGLFSFSGRGGRQELNAQEARNGHGGWAVVDDDLQMAGPQPFLTLLAATTRHEMWSLGFEVVFTVSALLAFALTAI
ncbi:unnamed protein product [Polarella glacialis]|uniref:Uncharacterized protein n=1 Tax=Polarella glacialis TaxID=89957 RepID=A0A813F4M1_POLGL|nr:unnamed protein product [Polarella glacialis]